MSRLNTVFNCEPVNPLSYKDAIWHVRNWLPNVPFHRINPRAIHLFAYDYMKLSCPLTDIRHML